MVWILLAIEGIGNEVVAVGALLSVLGCAAVLVALYTSRHRGLAGDENQPAAVPDPPAVMVNGTCPICLEDEPHFACQTNCGHMYCTGCFVHYWRTSPRFPGCARCPYCRRNVRPRRSTTPCALCKLTPNCLFLSLLCCPAIPLQSYCMLSPPSQMRAPSIVPRRELREFLRTLSQVDLLHPVAGWRASPERNAAAMHGMRSQAQATHAVADYNARFGGAPRGVRHVTLCTAALGNNLGLAVSPRQVLAHLRDAPLLLQRAVTDVATGRLVLASLVGAKVVLAILAAVIYALAPVDLVPEILFGVVGIVDDLIVLGACTLRWVRHVVAQCFITVACCSRGGFVRRPLVPQSCRSTSCASGEGRVISTRPQNWILVVGDLEVLRSPTKHRTGRHKNKTDNACTRCTEQMTSSKAQRAS